MEIDIMSRCRICLGEHVNMVSMFESKDDSVLLCDKIERCGGVHVSEGDGGPSHICYTCLEELYEALRFREKCENSDKQIRTTLEQFRDKVFPIISDKADSLSIKEEVNYDNDSNFDGFDTALNFKDEYLDDLKIEYSNENNDKNISVEPLKTMKLPRASRNKKSNTLLKDISFCEDSLMTEQKNKRKKNRKLNLNRLRKDTSASKKRGRKPKVLDDLSIEIDSKDFLLTSLKGEFKCDVCKKVFLGAKTYNNHMKAHLKTRDHKCDICGKEFKYKDNLKVHYMIHTGERPFQCDLCDKSFSKKNNLDIHRKRHLKERNYSCDQCGSSYYTSYELKTHTRVHTGEKPHVCTLCGKSFTAKNNLYIHQRSHTGEKPHPCNVCGKQFNSKNILSIHSRIHTGEKPYICSVCGKRFAANKLAVHMRTHTGEKPHVCPLCNKRFSATNVLVIHMRRHTGEKPYHCKICGQTYGHTQSLNKHLRKHHKVITNGTEVEMQELHDENQVLLEGKVLSADISNLSPEMPNHTHLDQHDITSTVEMLNIPSPIAYDVPSLPQEVLKIT